MKYHSMRAVAAGALTLSMLLAGCSSGGGQTSGSAGSDPIGTWGVGGSGNPQLVLTDDGKVSGTDGCNQLGGNWTIDGGTISFGQVVSTLMACPGVDTWLIELSTATVSGDTMTILDAGGGEIGTLEKQ